ncbi:N-acetylglucosaminyldiphosphodolichol N-acetylglucosaminyltransferase catalytic subunit alg13 [Coemansia javaensis]|uniref:UDP-N-acetylglucosamine transferase subunit ALG13 n=1 Tax=Coemansia javaensis TaxID=2761396 RepID=A0A9W8HDT5_9FUNG|nr:N-acetylglucosaminyldiphosphodolichol N-acetylglucosaminyltransferase catalytic subunit alg13 [Coemansia javaensis]
MSVYVTVGSTGFDALVQAVCAPEFMRALGGRGFWRLVVQCGASLARFEPPPAVREEFGVTATALAYVDRPQWHIEQADLVICHAGAGSILDALRAGKPTIAVPNRALADDHQRELARELARGGYLAVAEPEDLAQAVSAGAYAGLQPYPRADPRPIGDILDEETAL